LKSSFLRWLAPKDISRLAQLQLFAREVVEGVSGGIHRSRLIGASIEFKEHRPYVPGDEVRSIDWKLFGKTDRLYIRQYEDETNLRCTLVLDQSGSMKYAGSRSQGLSKHEYAVKLAASFAYLLVSQQDAVGLATFDTTIRNSIPPRSRPNHLNILLDCLAKSVPGQETDLSQVLQDILHQIRRRGVLVLFSDCFGDIDSLVRALALLRSNYQDVIVFQILDEDELDFPFQQRTMFRSLENQAHTKLVDPRSLRAAYQANFRTFQNKLTDGCRQHGVDLETVRTTESVGDVVARYIAYRRSTT
jgi:uncharacterized protein (DUF58 family)